MDANVRTVTDPTGKYFSEVTASKFRKMAEQKPRFGLKTLESGNLGLGLRG